MGFRNQGFTLVQALPPPPHLAAPLRNKLPSASVIIRQQSFSDPSPVSGLCSAAEVGGCGAPELKKSAEEITRPANHLISPQELRPRHRMKESFRFTLHIPMFKGGGENTGEIDAPVGKIIEAPISACVRLSCPRSKDPPVRRENRPWSRYLRCVVRRLEKKLTGCSRGSEGALCKGR